MASRNNNTRRNRRGLRFSNTNAVKEFTFGAPPFILGANSSRPTIPGPNIELPERTLNEISVAPRMPRGYPRSGPLVPNLVTGNERADPNWSAISAGLMRRAKNTARRGLNTRRLPHSRAEGLAAGMENARAAANPAAVSNTPLDALNSAILRYERIVNANSSNTAIRAPAPLSRGNSIPRYSLRNFMRRGPRATRVNKPRSILKRPR